MAIARRLCSGTPVLLADEHTGNLDGENTRIVMDIKGKTRTRVQEDTVLVNFPLFCLKCKAVTRVISVGENMVLCEEL